MASSSDSSKNSKGRRFRSTARELILRWRYRGHAGRLIRRHRALRSLDVQTSSFVHPLALTAGALAAIVVFRNTITALWAEIISFWCSSIGIDAVVRMRPVYIAGTFSYSIPEMKIASHLPSAEALATSFALVFAAMLIAYVAFRRFLPLAYLIWAIGLIQLTAIGSFYFSPAEFPYSIASHISSSLEVVLMLMAIIPLLLMIAYYPLNFSLAKKLALTFLMMAMVCVFAPHLYACHIVLLTAFSVLYMPVLFTVFGLLPIILMVIAIYGWGMSWVQRY